MRYRPLARSAPPVVGVFLNLARCFTQRRSLQIAQSFLCQRLQATRRDVFLNLAVPQGTVKLGEPRSKFSEFSGGKSANSVLDLSNGAHTTKSTSLGQQGATGGNG